MTKTLYLHIGVPKTGSTSIQQSFFGSDNKVLKRHDVAYFPYPAPNHSPAIMCLFSQKGKDVTAKQRLSERQFEAKRKEIDALLKAFLRDPVGTKIISGEDISGLTENEVLDLKRFTENVSECDIKIIVYVRNYYQFLDSRVQERVKTVPLDAINASIMAGKQDILPQYRFRIEKFIKIFGRENVSIRVFDSRLFKSADLLADFCDAIAVPDLFKDLNKIRANNSVSDETVRILSKYNEFFPLKRGKNYNPARTEKVRTYFNSPNGTKFRVTDPKILEAYEALISGDKEFIRESLGENLSAYVIQRPGDSLPPNEDVSLDFEYLFRTMGKILLDLVSYENALKITLATASESEDKREKSAFDRSIKFISIDEICRKLSRGFLKLGKESQARALAERAIELDVENPENHMLIANLLARQGTWAEAERAYRHVIRLDPTNSTARRKLSGCLNKLGRRAQAASVAQEAMELSPEKEEYQQHFQKLTAHRSPQAKRKNLGS